MIRLWLCFSVRLILERKSLSIKKYSQCNVIVAQDLDESRQNFVTLNLVNFVMTILLLVKLERRQQNINY